MVNSLCLVVTQWEIILADVAKTTSFVKLEVSLVMQFIKTLQTETQQQSLLLSLLIPYSLLLWVCFDADL